MRKLVFGAAVLVFLGCTPAPATEPTLEDMRLEGLLQANKEGGSDASGIACLPAAGADRATCFIVNDEEANLQRASIRNGTLSAGAALEIAAPNDGNTFGVAPDDLAPRCRKEEEPESYDREAISVAGDGYIYLVGSHGCSRKKNKYDAYGFLVTRFRLDAGGAAVDVQHSYRLSETLRVTAPFGSYFGRRLQPGDDAPPPSQQGLNIEGAVVVGDELLVGLRAPSLNGQAFLVSVPVAGLFSDGSLIPSRTRTLSLGADVGVRDVVSLENGDLLVLAGPTEEQAEVEFSLYRVNAANEARRLASVGRPSAKAEAVLVLQDNAQLLDVVVIYDGPRDGAPRRVLIAP